MALRGHHASCPVHIVEHVCDTHHVLQEKVHTFTVPDGSQKRLDAFLSANMQSTSRARLQNIIKEGYVAVNGKPASKAGQGIRQGDTVTCEVPPAVPIEASPEVQHSQSFSLGPCALVHP